MFGHKHKQQTPAATNADDNLAANSTADTAATPATDSAAYRTELQALAEENSARLAWLKRELERQQNLLAAANGMEKAAKNKLRAQQDELNRLEEESRAAILALAQAKQKSDRLNVEYNRLLERVKEQRTTTEHQTDELTAQQQQAKQLVNELQQRTFFGNRQTQLLQEIDAGRTDNLPPLAELLPPQPQKADTDSSPGTPNAKSDKNHANADFWEKGAAHTSLKLKAAPANDSPADTATSTEATPPAADTNAEAEATAPRPGRLRSLFSYIICIALAVAAALAIRTWVLMPTEVSGTSMVPTLQSADKLLTSPLPYIWGEPQRGDIIVFQAPNEAEGVYYVKRVIGLPGDRVLIDNGSVYINDEPLDEPYLDDIATEGYVNTQVPQNSVFVLGDNRTVSHDSRANDVACISYEEIYGKALWRIAPFDDFGSIY